jgi:hypothetical protein
MTLKIYPATSWKNKDYPDVVRALRNDGHEVFDFREANRGFRWACRTLQEFIQQIETDPAATAAFERDKDALDWCQALVLILPCGRSAHLEAAYAGAQGKPVIVKLSIDEPLKPELMYLLITDLRFATTTAEMLTALRSIEQRGATSMPNKEISELAERALTLANNDIVQGVEILREWTGLGFDIAFRAIDEAQPLQCHDSIEGEL